MKYIGKRMNIKSSIRDDFSDITQADFQISSCIVAPSCEENAFQKYAYD